jgi:hypothetical protein
MKLRYWKWKHIVGWGAVTLGLVAGIIPGLFLFQGSMINFGILLLVLGILVLAILEAVDELRQIRRAIVRLAYFELSDDARQSGYAPDSPSAPEAANGPGRPAG